MSVTDLVIDPFNSGKSRNPGDTQKFLADPVSTLRGRGINVPPASEAAWRQLSAALRQLQAASTKQSSVDYKHPDLYINIYIPVS